MARFTLAMQVANSGSPNDLPCAGAASECYLAIGSVTPADPDHLTTTTLFVPKICNGRRYSAFTDAATGTPTSTIELPDMPGAAVVLTFSVYWGSRAIDRVLIAVAERAVGVGFGGLYAQIAGVGAGLAGALIGERLEVFEKRLAGAIRRDGESFVDTIGVRVVKDFGALVQDGAATLTIRSDVDRQESFLDMPVISTGDLVATVTLRATG